MTAADDARAELAKVMSVVMTARRLMAEGTLLDLSAIEDRIRYVCLILGEAPATESLAVRDDAITLLDSLARLEEEIWVHIQKVKTELGD